MRAVGNLLFSIFTIGYTLYLMFKSEPTIKDLVWLGGMILIIVFFLDLKIDSIKEKFSKP